MVLYLGAIFTRLQHLQELNVKVTLNNKKVEFEKDIHDHPELQQLILVAQNTGKCSFPRRGI